MRETSAGEGLVKSLGRRIGRGWGDRSGGREKKREEPDRGSGAPAEGRRVDGRVPQPDEVIVELEERDREPGHLEARDVVADQAPPDRDPLSAEDLRDA